jgi:hypothetical protein
MLGRTRCTATLAVATLVVTAAVATAPASGRAAADRPARSLAANTQAPSSPYGNPYNDYLREPFGVPASGQANTPPVTDDPAQPFDWYRIPRASLGVYGGVQDTMISPEGFLQNDFGTLKFYTGDNLTPIDQRVKTFKDGWLPVAEFNAGPSYHFEYFDSTVPGVTKIPVTDTYGVSTRQTTASADVDNIITFAKVTVTNTTSSAGTFTLGVGLGSQPITNPVHRGGPLPANIGYDADQQALVGDGKALFTVSAAPSQVVGGTEHVLRYGMTLAPGQSEDLVVKLPYWVAQQSDVPALQNANYGQQRTATEQFWTRTLAQAGDVQIPEPKVADAYRANVVQLLSSALTIVGDHWSLTANPTIYHRFYLRDGAFHIEALLDAGFPDVARHILWDYAAWQDPDSGRYVGLQSSEYDSNGEALWTIAQYYRRTHDLSLVQHLWPSIQAAMAWEWQYRQDNWANSGGLYPVNSIGDDEQVQGHIVGFDLWAISGEFGAADVARALGENNLAKTWQQRAQQFAQILVDAVRPQFDRAGVVPPATEGVDGTGLEDAWYGPVYGIDWGNIGLVWPSGVFRADDPMVTSSLRVWSQQEFEGVFGYPANGRESLLHSYAPDGIPEAYLRAGDQWDALRYVYDLLVHTTAMHMASEGMDAATRNDWSTSNNTEPHNQFSAEYVSLARDMLCYEDAQDSVLHLANVYSPQWTQPGAHIAFAGPTSYGRTSFDITMQRDGMTMRLSPPTRNAPSQIVVSTPQGTVVTEVQGAPASAQDNQITLRGLTGPVTLQIRWRTTQPAPGYSYQRAVTDYEADYQKMTEAPQLSVQDVAPAQTTVVAGDPVVVHATVVNAGGAGRLDDPDITLYVDGQPAATDSRDLARGVGFSTPSSVISFGRNTEGVIPVTLSTQICGAGQHQIAVGVAGRPPTPGQSVTITERPPTAPAPSAALTANAAPRYVDQGANTTVSATLTNTGCQAISDADVMLPAPDGWTVTATTPTHLDTLAPGASAQLAWQVTTGSSPADEPVAEANLAASADYGWSGQTRADVTGTTTVDALRPVQPPYQTAALTEAHFGQGGQRFTIFAGGRDMSTSHDEYGSIYLPQAASTSTTATTEVTAQGDTWPWAKAGLMMRANIGAHTAGYAEIGVTPGHGCELKWDANGDGKLEKTASTGSTSYPTYLKLARSGTTFTGYCSADGTTWQQVGTATVPSATGTEDVGLFASAVNVDVPGAISRVEYTGLTVTH